LLKVLLKNDRLIILLAPAIMLVGVVLKMVDGLEPLHADSIFYLGFLNAWPTWLNYCICAALALITGFAANQAVQNLGILGRISNLPNLFVVLLFFMLPEEGNFFYLWGIFFLQLAVLRWVEQIPDEQKKLSVFVFNASLVIGILSLLEGWAILYFLLIIQSLAAVGMVTLKRIAIGFLGLIVPFYFYNAFLFLFNVSYHLPSLEFAFSTVLLPFERQSITAVMLIVFMLLMAINSLYGTAGSSTLRVRRRWMIVVSFMVISSFIVLNSDYRDMAMFVVLPFSIVISKVLITVKNQRLGSLYLTLFLLILFLYNT
jgi:hypothetical protein